MAIASTSLLVRIISFVGPGPWRACLSMSTSSVGLKSRLTSDYLIELPRETVSLRIQSSVRLAVFPQQVLLLKGSLFMPKAPLYGHLHQYLGYYQAPPRPPSSPPPPRGISPPPPPAQPPPVTVSLYKMSGDFLGEVTIRKEIFMKSQILWHMVTHKYPPEGENVHWKLVKSPESEDVSDVGDSSVLDRDDIPIKTNCNVTCVSQMNTPEEIQETVDLVHERLQFLNPWNATYELPLPQRAVWSSLHTLRLFDRALDGRIHPRGAIMYMSSINHFHFPLKLKTLILGRSWNCVLDPRSLPRQLETLVFGDKFSKDFDWNGLPPGLVNLKFGKDYGQARQRHLWSGQRHVCPPALKALILGDRFDQCLQTIKFNDGLEHLHIGFAVGEGEVFPGWGASRPQRRGGHFNQALDHIAFPSTLKALTLGNSFNKPLVGISWNNLKILILGDDFNQPLHGDQYMLPSQLEHFALGEKYGHTLCGVALPDTLKFLKMGGRIGCSRRRDNRRLEEMKWPPNLERLVLPEHWDHSLWPCPLPKNEKLKHLEFGYRFNQPIQRQYAFPLGLVTLTFGGKFNQSLDGCNFGTELTTLIFGRDFFQDMSHWTGLPESLEHVMFCKEYGQEHCDFLKQSLDANAFLKAAVKVTFIEHYYNEKDKDQKQLTLLEEILKGDKISNKQTPKPSSPPVKPAPPTARRPDTTPVNGPIQAKTPPPQLPPPKPKCPPPCFPPTVIENICHQDTGGASSSTSELKPVGFIEHYIEKDNDKKQVKLSEENLNGDKIWNKKIPKPSSPPFKPAPPTARRPDTTPVYGPIQAKTPPLQLPPPKPKRPPPCFPPTVTRENICHQDTGGASSSTSELKPVGETSKSMLVSGSQPRSDWQ